MEINNEDIINKALDETYRQYESDHDFRCMLFIHPMFYNGTFSENNSCQPEEPEILLTKEELFVKIKEDNNSRWGIAFQTLFIYFSKIATN